MKIYIKMETTEKKIILSCTTDSHLLVLPLNIVLGDYLNRYEMDYIGQEGNFYKYHFKSKNQAIASIPEIAKKDALGIDMFW